jgi:voltage-gated potassium channel
MFIGIVLVATAGYEMAGWTAFDAFYMVIITIFGVGYGEVHPINTPGLQLFTIGLIISGYIAAIYTIGAVVRIITEGEVKTMLNEIKHGRSLEEMTGHTIICGFGRIGQILAQDLVARKHPFVVIDSDDARYAKATAAGYLALQGNATEEDTLLRAGIVRATNLATVLPQDELNVFITLTARDLNAKLRIIARGEQPNTERKLRQAGANEVIMPALIGGHRIAHALSSPALGDLLDDLRDSGASGDLHRIGLDMIDVDITACPQFAGMDLDTLQRRAGGMLIIALHRADGTLLESPDHALVCEPGDHVVAMTQPSRLPANFLKPSVAPRRLYRGIEVA